MAFEWDRIHKHEDNIMNDIFERVKERVEEHYNVDDVVNLTQEQIDELAVYTEEELDKHSVMQCGFTDVINYWESTQVAILEADNDNNVGEG